MLVRKVLKGIYNNINNYNLKKQNKTCGNILTLATLTPFNFLKFYFIGDILRANDEVMKVMNQYQMKVDGSSGKSDPGRKLYCFFFLKAKTIIIKDLF